MQSITDRNQEWLENIDARLNQVEEMLTRITQDGMLAGRKPHACPLCIVEDGFFHGDYCVGCEGKGIVWG